MESKELNEMKDEKKKSGVLYCIKLYDIDV